MNCCSRRCCHPAGSKGDVDITGCAEGGAGHQCDAGFIQQVFCELEAGLEVLWDCTFFMDLIRSAGPTEVPGNREPCKGESCWINCFWVSRVGLLVVVRVVSG